MPINCSCLIIAIRIGIGIIGWLARASTTLLYSFLRVTLKVMIGKMTIWADELLVARYNSVVLGRRDARWQSEFWMRESVVCCYNLVFPHSPTWNIYRGRQTHAASLYNWIRIEQEDQNHISLRIEKTPAWYWARRQRGEYGDDQECHVTISVAQGLIIVGRQSSAQINVT